MPSERDFTWRDGERTVVFREGVFADAPDLLGQGIWGRFELLTTPTGARVRIGRARGALEARSTRFPAGRCPRRPRRSSTRCETRRS